MDCSIVLMLEAMKQGTFTNVEDYINEGEQKRIIAWFNQYAHGKDDNVKISIIVELLYELYIRENIDFYSTEEFQRVTIALAEKYHFDRIQFLGMLQSFRTLIYGEN